MDLRDEPSGTRVATKADQPKRLLAYLIDAVIAGLAAALMTFIIPALGGLVGAAYMLVRDGLDVSNMDGRSLGKKILNLRPVRLDGLPMDLETSIRRNWMFAVGGLTPTLFHFGLAGFLSIAGTVLFIYEVYRVLTAPDGRRWGDELAGTIVIEEPGH